MFTYRLIAPRNALPTPSFALHDPRAYPPLLRVRGLRSSRAANPVVRRRTALGDTSRPAVRPRA